MATNENSPASLTARRAETNQSTARILQQADSGNNNNNGPSTEFVETEEGVFAVQRNDDGPRKIFLCGPVTATGRMCDEAGANHGLLVQYVEPRSRKILDFNLPMEVASGDSAALSRILRSRGLTVSNNPKSRVLLLQYFAEKHRSEIPWLTLTDRCGWHGNAFVLPRTAVKQGFFFIGEGPKIVSRGSLEEWRNQVSHPAQKNHRLCFVIAMAFAAPLIETVRGESGGFHFWGDSSVGKSTIAAVACSVFGPPKIENGDAGYLQSWRSTANGVEALAVAHSDLLLVLDEIGQAEAEDLDKGLYQLADGLGKQRADVRGMALPRAIWRAMVLSTGEMSHSEKLRSKNIKAHAGQDIRFINFEADAGKFHTVTGESLGCYDDTGDLDPAAFTRQIRDAAQEHHGIAGEQFLDLVVSKRTFVRDFLATQIAQFRSKHADKAESGQVRRAIDRFALVAAAGELATHFGLTGWSEGTALIAAGVLLSDWLRSRGTAGRLEDEQIKAQVRKFFEEYGESRFTPIKTFVDGQSDKADPQRVALTRAGFRSIGSDGDEEFWVLSGPFTDEVCRGFNRKKACQVLVNAGILRKGDAENYRTLKHLPQIGTKSVYNITSKVFE